MKLGLAPVLFASAIALVGCGSESDASDAPIVEQAPSAREAIPAQASTSNESTPGQSSTPSEPAKLGAPYPVVLLHGMSGFGTLEVGPVAITYFNGVVEDLTKSGESVFVTLAPPYDTS